jgi:hypothetical protein
MTISCMIIDLDKQIVGASQICKNTKNEQLSVTLKLVQIYEQLPVSIPRWIQSFFVGLAGSIDLLQKSKSNKH